MVEQEIQAALLVRQAPLLLRLAEYSGSHHQSRLEEGHTIVAIPTLMVTGSLVLSCTRRERGMQQPRRFCSLPSGGCCIPEVKQRDSAVPNEQGNIQQRALVAISSTRSRKSLASTPLVLPTSLNLPLKCACCRKAGRRRALLRGGDQERPMVLNRDCGGLDTRRSLLAALVGMHLDRSLH